MMRAFFTAAAMMAVGILTACQTTPPADLSLLNAPKAQSMVVGINSYNSDLIKIYKKQNLDLTPITEKITGTIYRPEGQGPFPAIVVFHGCGGALENSYMWAKWFQERGVVSLVVDGFRPRGIKEICTDFKRIRWETRVNDAYGGAAFLASLPFVDKTKIGITGYSNGAGRALNVVEKRYQEKIGDAIPKFAYSIPLYPECRGSFASHSSGFKAGPYGSPVMILIGEDDDWTLASSCQKMAEVTKNDEHPVDVRVYPGAHHGFDHHNDNYDYQSASNINSPTGMGATVRTSNTAKAAAKVDIEKYLKKMGMMK